VTFKKLIMTHAEDESASRVSAIAIGCLVFVLCAGIIVLLPQVAGVVDPIFSEGLGLKSAAIFSFFLTLVVMLVLALVAGDGLVGVLQFMLIGFLTFFVVSWLMLAWIF